MAKVVILGPAHPLRGGISAFNHRLAKQLIAEGHDCKIFSFSLQYPSFLFPGKTQFSTDLPPDEIKIESAVNSINPFNWLRVGNRIKKEKPDVLIVRYWLPFMGPCLGTILRRVKKNKHTKIVCIADNIIPHEKRVGDKLFTRYFIKACDAFLVMSEQVLNDLKSFDDKKPVRLSPHPLYDNFGDIITKDAAREALNISMSEKVILFFGFIRKYKGLDLLLKAMAQEGVKRNGIKLLIAGEFYDEEKSYRELAATLGITDAIIWHTDFIPESSVKNYFCAADVVVQPYKHATQSGVTPMVYHFERPMIVTNVGGLPDLVPHEKVGLVAAPNPESIADSILRFYELGERHFIPHVCEQKKEYSWANFTSEIFYLTTN